MSSYLESNADSVVTALGKSLLKNRHDRIHALNRSELHDWFKEEFSYWENIIQVMNEKDQAHKRVQIASTNRFFIQQISDYCTQLSRMTTELEKNTSPNDENVHSEMWEKVKIIYDINLPKHDDPLAEDFKYACYSGVAASAIYTYRIISVAADPFYLRGYEEKVEANLASLSERIDKNVREVLQDFSDKEKIINDSVVSGKDHIEKIVSAATAAVSLSEPVKFWEERKGLHNINAKKYGKYASISAMIFSILLGVTIGYEYVSGVPRNFWGFEFTLPKTLSGIAMILLVSTAGIWCTRIFVKLMMANLTLETESIERATMIKTFVAMKAAESSIAQEAELLFYTTLFRPSNNLISEESTAPEFGKILETILKTKGDKPTGAG
ncbi:hypothetical protein H5A44_15005 [Pectobacterium brasiliense]|uniref:DUF6161 domain-containing protein n=2 Tax=Pectobacterium TaxID=122277 RepID=A0AAW3SRY8_9GAMM|nr:MULTISPECIES: DUF6161 domain-containing protein [Pectobacterium]MBA5203324.1 hypothetical protein [Pectobacterium aroidearum]MBN3343744.1 hypothetical protein [Pectobacterium brasiliense]URG47492.1 hypothetical protein IG609_011680 [Pectobacterium quasiaquaticum]